MLSQEQLCLHPKEALAVCLSMSMPASTKEARENGAGTAQRCVNLCSLSQYQFDHSWICPLLFSLASGVAVYFAFGLSSFLHCE